MRGGSSIKCCHQRMGQSHPKQNPDAAITRAGSAAARASKGNGQPEAASTNTGAVMKAFWGLVVSRSNPTPSNHGTRSLTPRKPR